MTVWRVRGTILGNEVVATVTDEGRWEVEPISNLNYLGLTLVMFGDRGPYWESPRGIARWIAFC